MHFSFWEQNTFIKSPDVVIIGSGIVGLNAALAIKKKSPGLHVLILERGMLPYGASTRNAGFACYGSPSELLEDLQNNSEDEVFALVEKRWNGLLRLRKILGDEAICYEPLGGFEIFTATDKELYDQCRSHLASFNQRLYSITGEKEMYRTTDEKISSFGLRNIDHIIHNIGEGLIDTGRMMKALLEKTRDAGVEILNGANVDRLEDDVNSVGIHLSNTQPSTPESQSTIIRSKCVLICVNGFAKKFLPDYDIQAARSQVLITSPIENLRIRGSFTFDHGYYYFRNVGNRLLFGGGRNLDYEKEFTDEMKLTGKIQSHLDELLSTIILPSEKYSIDMRWSGIMGLGKKKSPIIKKTGESIYCAVRMGGMGIAIGSLVGEEAAEMIVQNL